jgi:putative membrane protein
MIKVMSKTVLFRRLTSFVLFVLMVACSREVSYEEALRKNQQEFKDEKKLEDAYFLVAAKSLNMLATELLKLASDSGYSSAVVNFAGRNLEEHRGMDEDVLDIARKAEITLPTEMSSGHQVLFHQVSSAARSEFDRSFVTVMKRINDEITGRYYRNATEAFNPDIRAFAARRLDLLKTHAKSIAAIEEQLLSTSD